MFEREDIDSNSEFDYRGKRGVVLLRVSTEEQEKKYGLPSQLRSVREKIVSPLGIRILDEEKHIIRDIYTGMEFREREALTKILEMAKRREFDVLIMDVLDRLGRVGLPREIYRAELLMHGVRILTTKPEEHADDDSLMGQMIRLLHGFKSQGERDDLIRRTQNGKKERVLQDHKLLGTGRPKYGFKFKDEDKSAYILDNDHIQIPLDGRLLVDENGEPWTKAKVRRHMFEWLDQGWTEKGIARYLTSQYIPTGTEGKWQADQISKIIKNRNLNLESDKPILAYGYLTVLDENGKPYTDLSVAQLIYDLTDKDMNGTKIANFLNEKHIPTGKEAEWHLSSVAKMLADEYVIGKAAVFVHHTENKPGVKKLTKARPKEEWIYLPEGVVPPILVTEDGKPDIALFERVQQRKSINKENATRNNSNPENYLLRGSYIKCGYCGRNMNAANIGNQGKDRFTYICFSNSNQNNKCSTGLYVRVNANIVDDAAWSKALEIIRDPLEVDRKIEARRTEDPNADRLQHITGELAKIKATQKRLRDRLEDEDLDDDTYADLKIRLKNLADMKRDYEHELSIEIDIHAEWLKIQEQLNHFHKRCQEMREKLNDRNYESSYDFKRDAIEFFGIIVRVRKPQDPPRITVESSPPSIESNSIGQKRRFPGR